ncbi:hypothetical protein [Hufsiella ginkgonis]|uniref:Rpn family recombination-promoting nuclease/putative transposase n=1 Tax=Hufsiella ginkgonis TaxID=2695274 RepID=A0A7K1XW46_9SPHI|nr:hypothetical protein [Hufsiella ginkgonis]MXV15215.1 hypothetical protein [Hufsiella ginkgonis]
MANNYDKILRENFRQPKKLLVSELLNTDPVRVVPLVPKIQHTILERETDTIAEVLTSDGKLVILHIEWQSSNDPKMGLRMAIYDLLLHQTYEKDVIGVVLYVGRSKMTMTGKLAFAGLRYKCIILDIRRFDPSMFLESDDPGEIILAVLAGGENDKSQVVNRIFVKLQQLLDNDKTELKKRIRQLELLSLLRGEDVQRLVNKKEDKMAVTIDITRDLKYRAGLEKGQERFFKGINQMLSEGYSQTEIQRFFGLSKKEINRVMALNDAAVKDQ